MPPPARMQATSRERYRTSRNRTMTTLFSCLLRARYNWRALGRHTDGVHIHTAVPALTPQTAGPEFERMKTVFSSPSFSFNEERFFCLFVEWIRVHRPPAPLYGNSCTHPADPVVRRHREGLTISRFTDKSNHFSTVPRRSGRAV